MRTAVLGMVVELTWLDVLGAGLVGLALTLGLLAWRHP
jgi:hypothetical protein